jgi:hypothetical protein
MTKQQHVQQIARENNIRVVIVKGLSDYDIHGEDSDDNSLPRTLVTSPITSDRIYAIALHELGHFIDPNGELTKGWMVYRSLFGPDPSEIADMLKEEQASWDWGKTHSAFGWTADMEAVYREGYSSYVNRANGVNNA